MSSSERMGAARQYSREDFSAVRRARPFARSHEVFSFGQTKKQITLTTYCLVAIFSVTYLLLPARTVSCKQEVDNLPIFRHVAIGILFAQAAYQLSIMVF